MNVTIYLGAAEVRTWHLRLLERLAGRPGFKPSVMRLPEPETPSPGIALLFAFETRLHGLPVNGLGTLAAPGSLEAYDTGTPSETSLVLDLAGTYEGAGATVWRLAFNGVPGENALLCAILARRTPVASLSDRGTVIVAGRLGTEYNGITRATFEDCLARTITLILAAFDGAATSYLPAAGLDDETPAPPPAPQIAGLFQKMAKDSVRTGMRAVFDRIYHTPHWRVGWRVLTGPGLAALGQHPEGGWTDLRDDGLRFYADPFPLEHGRKVTLFVEEFDHRSQKGVISAMPFGPRGPEGPMERVLERPYHLSYPFVFEQDGEIWMIPESCAANAIDLYRARAYPHDWVLETTLVGNVRASDATLLEHEGRWWLFATVHDGGSFSDALHLWSAPHFRGPWTAHAKNPVLIDIASARPAGRIVMREGALIRPVQDCRRGYGHALALARIIRLDDGGFEQIVETILHAGAAWPGRRIHSLNSAGGLEFIDGSGLARRRVSNILGLR